MKKLILFAITLALILTSLNNAVPPAVISACGDDVNNATNLNWELNGNLTVASNATCLNLNTSNVIVDCKGFTIMTDDFSANRSAINVTAPYVTLRGCNIVGFNFFDTDSFFDHGKAVLVNASNFTFYNSTIYNSYFAVFFGRASDAATNHTFYNLTFYNQSENVGALFKSTTSSLSNSTFYNLNATDYRGYGFALHSMGNGIRIFNNTFMNISADIITINSESTDAQIYNNTISISGGTSISVSGSNAQIYDNTIFNYTQNAISVTAANASVYRNTLLNNSGTQAAAILFGSGSSGSRAYNNTIQNYQSDITVTNVFLFKAAILASTANVTTSDNVFNNVTEAIGAAANANLTSFRDTHLNPVSYEYRAFSGTGFFVSWSTINIINSTYRVNSSGINVTNNGTINVQQPMNVSIYNNGALAANANISILNTNQVEVINVTANSNGYALVNLTYLKFNETGSVNYTPHNFTYDNGTLILYNSTGVTLQSAAQQIEINNGPVVDASGPTFTVNSPVNNSNQSSTTLTINFSATDASNVSACWYSINGTTNVTIAGCTSGLTNQTTTTVSVSANQNITIYANDSLGNLASIVKTFTIDTTAPTLTVNNPANNTNQSSTTLTINFSATDTSGLSTCWYSINSTANVTVAGCTTGTTNQTTATVSAATGQNITIYVNDTAGNLVSTVRYFNVDIAPPGITLNTPVNNTNQSTLVLNFSATDDAALTCWYSLNGTANVSISGCVSGTNNETTIVVTDGLGQNITLWVNDSFGNIASKTRTFNIESTAPTITFNLPVNNTNQTSATLTINFSATDASALSTCWYSINGTTNVSIAGCANATTNQTTATVSAALGQNVTAYVNDSFGNLASSTRFFNIDTTGPSITVNAPVNNTNQSTNNLTINISVVDSTGISACWYSINSTTNTTITGCVNSTTNQTSVNVSLTTGQNITVYANDTLGNLASAVRFFNVNDSTPQITAVVNTTARTNSTITWTTDSSANSTIDYGTSTSLGSSETSTSYETSHSIVITGLTANTLYYYNVTSCNVYTTCNTTGPYSFTTNASSSGGSSGGSGSAGSAASMPTLQQPVLTAGPGETVELTDFDHTSTNPRIKASVNSKVAYTHRNTQHSVQVGQVIGLRVTLTLRSDPITVTMVQGEEKTFDITGDKQDDITLKVISVSGQTVVFEINPINVIPKSTTVQTPVSTPVQTVQPEVQEDTQPVAVVSQPAPQQSPMLPIIVIVVVLAILAYWQIKLRNKPAIVTNYDISKKKTK